MNKLLPFVFLLTIIVACDKEMERCPDGLSYKRNSHLDYLPYNVGDEIFLIDSLGNRDTLTVTSYSTELHQKGRECVESENIKVDVKLNYDMSKMCNISFRSQISPHVFSASSSGECIVGGHSYDNMNHISNYEFEGVNYERVLEINLEAANAAFEKIVIAKDTGFLFFTINGITQKVI